MKVRWTAAAVLATASILGVAAPSALANGPCGVDFDSNSACAITSPYSINGSLITDNESDFYVFWAQAGTQISATITDTENPQCATPSFYPIDCGDVYVSLDDANGENVDGSSESQPASPGITVPATMSHTIEDTGQYYLVVSGGLTSNENTGQSYATPYSLSVSANPGVQWPPPPPAPPAPAPVSNPMCVVPQVYAQTLATVEHRLATHNCTPGKIYWVSKRGLRRYAHFPNWRIVYVGSLNGVHAWATGSHHPYDSRVGIVGIK